VTDGSARARVEEDIGRVGRAQVREHREPRQDAVALEPRLLEDARRRVVLRVTERVHPEVRRLHFRKLGKDGAGEMVLEGVTLKPKS
jgi:hypothetical protein